VGRDRQKRPTDVKRGLDEWRWRRGHTSAHCAMIDICHSPVVIVIRRDSLWKETLKRDPHMWKEAYIYEKRPAKRRVHSSSWFVVIHCGKRPLKETPTYVKRGLYIWKETCETSCTFVIVIRCDSLWKETLKRDPHMWKEAYIYEKRPAKHRVDVRIVIIRRYSPLHSAHLLCVCVHGVSQVSFHIYRPLFTYEGLF